MSPRLSLLCWDRVCLWCRVKGTRLRHPDMTDAEIRAELLKGRSLFYFQDWLGQRNISLLVSKSFPLSSQ